MERFKSHIYDFLFLISVFSVLCLLCWKCRFGFGNVDEAFYLTIPWRLTQGDALFLEEWHLSQMSGFLLLPLVAIFRAFDSTAEGIILVFRYICITVQTLCCVWYYHRLKRISPAGAFAASILALIFIPFNITALSYNSMGIFLMGLSTVTLATLKGTPSARIDLLFSGVTFAGAVLCCPYLIVVYALAAAVIIAFAILDCFAGPAQERQSSTDDAGSGRRVIRLTPRAKDLLRGLFWFSAGAALLALVFAVFVLSRASIGDIVKAFPEIMNDPEHKPLSFLTKLQSYGRSIFHSSSWSPRVLIFLGLLLAAACFDKKRMERRPLYISLAIIAVGLMLISINIEKEYINHLMYPVNLLSVFCLLLTRSRNARKLFVSVVIPGMLYSLCIHFTSNQYFYVISSASTVSMLGTVPMLALLMHEITHPVQEAPDTSGNVPDDSDNVLGASGDVKDGSPAHCNPDGAKDRFPVGKRLISEFFPVFLSIMLIGTLCCLLTYKRATHIFWEYSIDAQTQLIDYGPESGVMTTIAKEQMYDRLMDAATYISEHTSSDSVLFLSESTWLYLACPELRNSAYSAWLSGINDDSIDRLMKYYKLNPDKLPDVIFADTDEEEYADILAKRLRYDSKTYIPTGGCIYREKH